MGRIGRVAVAALACVAWCAGGAVTASAAVLSITPVGIGLTRAQPFSALTVRNEGAEAVTLELEIATWSRVGDADLYAPTQDIVVSPAIVSVAPGASQTVRIGLRGRLPAGRELAYRVFMQEMPRFSTASSDPPVALRLAVPVFVAPEPLAEPTASGRRAALLWLARPVPGGLALSASNPGRTHVRVLDVAVTRKQGVRIAPRRAELAYVFPGQRQDWFVELGSAPAPGASVHVSASSDAGPIEADVVVGNAGPLAAPAG
jgi:fimbrial chaperone protein